MRLALVVACLLAVVSVTISPSSAKPAAGVEGIFDIFRGVTGTIKDLLATKIKVIQDKVKAGFRGRRDVEFESHRISESDLRTITELVSALEDASDILSSVEDVYEIIEGGSFEDDGSDLEDRADNDSAEDVDNEDGGGVNSGNGESGDKGEDGDVREGAKDKNGADKDRANGGV